MKQVQKNHKIRIRIRIRIRCPESFTSAKYNAFLCAGDAVVKICYYDLCSVLLNQKYCLHILIEVTNGQLYQSFDYHEILLVIHFCLD
jgi:hypothetical protein